MVKDINGEIELGVDMRDMNSVTSKNVDFAPTTDKLFMKCQGIKYMTRLNSARSFSI